MTDNLRDNPVAKLNLRRDEALAGPLSEYWAAKDRFELLGLDRYDVVKKVMDRMLSRSIASAMSEASMTDRACSTVPPGTVLLVRPSRDGPPSQGSDSPGPEAGGLS